MKIGVKIVVPILFLIQSLWGLKIEPFPKSGNLVDIFNTNCLQMTQSQQLLKAYIMKGLGSSFGNPSESLKIAIPAYEKRAVKIADYFKSRLQEPSAKKAFDDAFTLWRESRKLLEEKPTPENALVIKENFSRMIPLLLKGSGPIAKKTDGLELLSLTGMLCRGPMQISIDYLLKIWGADMPGYEEEMTKIIKDFHTHLETLKANRLNDEKSLKLLRDASNGFRYFEMMYNAKSTFVPSLLSHKADQNFQIIREIKSIYRQKVEAEKK